MYMYLAFTLLFCLPPHMMSFLVTHGHKLPHPCCVGVCSVGSTHSTHSMGTVHVSIQYGKQWCGVMYCVHVHCFVGTYIPAVCMWLYSHMGLQYNRLASCLSIVSEASEGYEKWGGKDFLCTCCKCISRTDMMQRNEHVIQPIWLTKEDLALQAQGMQYAPDPVH